MKPRENNFLKPFGVNVEFNFFGNSHWTVCIFIFTSSICQYAQCDCMHVAIEACSWCFPSNCFFFFVSFTSICLHIGYFFPIISFRVKSQIFILLDVLNFIWKSVNFLDRHKKTQCQNREKIKQMKVKRKIHVFFTRISFLVSVCSVEKLIDFRIFIDIFTLGVFLFTGDRNT